MRGMNIGRKTIIAPMNARIVPDIERNIDIVILLTIVNILITYRNRLVGIFLSKLSSTQRLVFVFDIRASRGSGERQEERR